MGVPILLISHINMVCEGCLVALVEICITVYHVLLLAVASASLFCIVYVVFKCVEA